MDLPIQYYLLIAGAIVLFVVVVVMRLRRPQPRMSSGSAYVEALKLLVDGDRNGAFFRLQEAVKGGTAPTDAYIKLGELLRERGDFGRALQIHQSLTVKTDLSRPEKVELFRNLAEDYAKTGNSKRAASVLESAIRNLNIKDARVYVTLARHYHMLGEGEKAYETLREAAKRGAIGDRELALYMATAADIQAGKGDVREARRTLQRGLKHDPECAPCLFVMGNVAEGQGDLDGAIEHWKRVAVLSPDLAATVMPRLEKTMFDRGRFGEIERVYNDIRNARTDDEEVTMALASFYDKQGRSDEAIALLEEFVTVRPECIRASLMLASLYARHRDSRTLEDFLDRSFEEPDEDIHYQCRSCHYESERMRWHCPRCNAFDSFSRNHHVA